MANKPTDKQLEVISTLKTILTYWEKTNDIKSPTHDGDIFEELHKLNLRESDMEELEENLQKLYYTIRDLKQTDGI